ncbi:hypothetical protein AALP_AA6G110500 [Arabis alpina]|uniref:Uncharacterized protein n=1 Tax=Arabis alpina TaxID=50452 RepID=A0A087GNH5_ARAAL|nr:hypothetical protein AALP_AA6G110500 [Arabis alpina]
MSLSAEVVDPLGEDPSARSRHTKDSRGNVSCADVPSNEGDQTSLVIGEGDSTILTRRVESPRSSPRSIEDPDDPRAEGRLFVDSLFVDDESPNLPLVKPSLPKVSKKFVTAMHTKRSSGNGNWRKSFSRRRIERAFSAEIFLGKILGRGQVRVFCREQAAAKAKRSSGELAEFPRLSAERTRISNGKGKGVGCETPSKRQRVDTYPAIVVGRETSASHVGGLLRDEAYSAVKSKASELFLFFDRLAGDYDEDIRSRDSELGAPKEANTALQPRLDELAERNKVLERDALSLLKRSRIDDSVAEARDEMARGFAERTSEVIGLLAEIGGKVKNDMLNLAEINANLEFIGLLQGSEPLDLPTEVKALREQRHPIYDAQDVFADRLASVRRVLEIHVVSADAAEVSVAVNDDVEVTDEDDVEMTDDEEDAED